MTRKRTRPTFSVLVLLVGTSVCRGALALPVFHAITESDPGGLNNVNFFSFDSLTDLTALNVSSQTSWNIASGISISGLTYDGLRYHMITESDPGGLNNVNFLSFDSLTDLTALNVSSQTSWNIASGVSFSALATTFEFGPPVSVPEPNSLWLLASGFLLTLLFRHGSARRLWNLDVSRKAKALVIGHLLAAIPGQ